MRRFTVVSGLALAIALSGTSAFAQLGIARGKVLDHEGNPLQGAVVTATLKAEKDLKYTSPPTNKKGEWVVTVMTSSKSWMLTATKEGWVDVGAPHQTEIRMGGTVDVPPISMVTEALAPRAKAAAAARKELANMSKEEREKLQAEAKAWEEIKGIFKTAVDLTNADQLDEAEVLFKEIVAKKDDVPEVHYNLGILYLRKKNFPSAEAAFVKALELRPDYLDAMIPLANVYQNTNQNAKAEEMLAKVVAGNPSDARAVFTLATVYFTSSKYPEALDAFNKVLALDAANAEPYYYIGSILISQNKTAEAVANLEKYVAGAPPTAVNVPTAQALIQALKPAAPKKK
jgi:Tfp pilus assembly protein PilF